jgi:hypothetical protein
MRIHVIAFCLLVLSTPLSAAEKILWLPDPGASRLDVDAEMKSVALAAAETFSGDDLLGLAFPAAFGSDAEHDFIYVAFAYDNGTSGAAQDRRSRIVQYQWDAEAGTLSDPVELRSGLSAGQKQ